MVPIEYRVVGEEDYALTIRIDSHGEFMVESGTYTSEPPRKGQLGEAQQKDLIEAIRQDKPYNEVKRGAEASLVTSMGRMAAHTGQIITYDQMLNCEHEMAPGLDKATEDMPAPVTLDANRKYPIPMPGIIKDREY